MIICTLIAFASCENALGPQLDKEQIVKTEVKWSVSPVGKAKQYIAEEVEYNRNGSVVKKYSYNKFGHLETSSTFEYLNNKEIEIKSEYSNNKLVKELIVTSTIKNGLVIREDIESNGAVLDSKQFTYDENGNIKSIKQCVDGNNCDNTIEYDNKYDNGNLTVTYTRDNQGNIDQKDSLVYRFDQNYFERITTDNQGNIYYTTGYKIDDDGKIVEEFIKNSDGLISVYYIYEFTYFD